MKPEYLTILNYSSFPHQITAQMQKPLEANRESWTCSASAEASVCLSAVPEMMSHEVNTSGRGGNFVCISYLWVSGRSSLQGIQEDVCVPASARCVFEWMCIQVLKEAVQNTSANIWVHRLCLVFQQVVEINTKNTHRLRAARGKSFSNPNPLNTHPHTSTHTSKPPDGPSSQFWHFLSLLHFLKHIS